MEEEEKKKLQNFLNRIHTSLPQMEPFTHSHLNKVRNPSQHRTSLLLEILIATAIFFVFVCGIVYTHSSESISTPHS